MPEEALDKLLAAIPAKLESGGEESAFEKYLQETTQKYKKVWEALSLLLVPANGAAFLLLTNGSD